MMEHSIRSAYADKFAALRDSTLLNDLGATDQAALYARAEHYRLTAQEVRQIVEIIIDLRMWHAPSLDALWPLDGRSEIATREQKKRALKHLHDYWEQRRLEPNEYPPLKAVETATDTTDQSMPDAVHLDACGESPQELRHLVALPKVDRILRDKTHLGLGYCPVASARTRCCQLMTLDVVDNCGFDCSYCSIQGFFEGSQVYFDPGFAERLRKLQLDPDRDYHIGTGQSSDSLMWGNAHGMLDALIDFAWRHPRVIVELKTKSTRVNALLRVPVPPNLVCTWSLNTPTLIAHEERGTASLEQRLTAARRLADQGQAVGFHFHPMIHYQDWQEDYAAVADQLQKRFDPAEVMMVSLGTLTFTRPVMQRIRKRQRFSQILKAPLVETQGKWSYPESLKRELLGTLAGYFRPEWRQQVFFYLCMEADALWQPVLGCDYPDNASFERTMLSHYFATIERLKKSTSPDHARISNPISS